MTDALFDVIEPAREAMLKQHLDECAACAKSYAELQKTIEVVATTQAEELPESYWEGYYGRLLQRMSVEAPRRSVSSYWQALRETWRSGLFPRLDWRFNVALGVALLLVGIMVGRSWQPATIDPVVATIDTQTPSELTQAALSARTERYLERSSVLLLGLVNVDLDQENVELLGLSHKQEMAGELMEEAGYLQTALDQSKERQLAQLVSDLEKILRQIANLEQQQDLPSIELIQRGVDRGDLLLKINLEKMKFMDHPSDTRSPAKGGRERNSFENAES